RRESAGAKNLHRRKAAAPEPDARARRLGDVPLSFRDSERSGDARSPRARVHRVRPMTSINRRRFLKAASAGVGTLAASWTANLSNASPASASSWSAGARSASLSGERQSSLANPNAEIVVVGAGAFGGWTALYLREMGHSVTLID